MMEQDATRMYWSQSTSHIATLPEDAEFYKRLEQRKLDEQTFIANTYRAEAVQRGMDQEVTNHYYDQCVRDLADSEDDNAELRTIIGEQDRRLDNQKHRIGDLLSSRQRLYRQNKQLQEQNDLLIGKEMIRNFREAFERVTRSSTQERPHGFWSI